MAYMKVRKSNDEWFTITDLTLDKLTLTTSLSTKSLSLVDNEIAFNNNSDKLNIANINNTKKLKLNDDIIALEKDLTSLKTNLEESINNITKITTGVTAIKSESAYASYEINVDENLPINIFTSNKKIHAFIKFNKKPNVTYLGDNEQNIAVITAGDDITVEEATDTLWELNIYVYEKTPYIIWKKWK